jgi:hypothetical protein
MKTTASGWHSRARPIVLALSALGFVLFASGWLVLAFQPKRVEAAAFDFMREKILEEAREKLHSSDALRRSVLVIQERLGREAGHLDELRESELADHLGEVLAALCSCRNGDELPTAREERKAAISAALRSEWFDRANRMRDAAAGLTEFVTERYHHRRDRLLAELRFFVGSNALLFLITLGMAAFRGEWARPLLVPTLLLMLTTVASSYVYAFEQDWFHSILFESYVGTAYLVYVALVFGTLLDVALNEARMTSALVDLIAAPVTVC